MLTTRAWVAAAGALILGVLAGALGGIYADQAYPDQLPGVFLRSPRGHLDLADTQQALRILQAHYYDPTLDYGKLAQGSARGLVQGLNDPYSEYLDPGQYKRLQGTYSGTNTGIGIYVQFSGDYPLISGVIPGTPAERGGLKAGDVIQAVNGKSTRGLKADEAAALIQGPVGTKVTLTVRRGDQSLDVTMTRALIQVPLVRSIMLENQVFYIRIFSFGTTTVGEFDTQLKAGLPTASGVVLDLRDDGGGFIDSATQVISRFVASGEAYELRDRQGGVDHRLVSGDHSAASIPMVALVNANTASASEIVSGSLQVHKRAELVGDKTFGKGSVQRDFPLEDGSDLHITIERWFLPDGRSVDKNGLIPDVPVALKTHDDMYQVASPAAGHTTDTQLNRALDLLASR